MWFFYLVGIIMIISAVLFLMFAANLKAGGSLISLTIFFLCIVLLAIEFDTDAISHCEVHPVVIEGIIPEYSEKGPKVQVKGEGDTVVEDYIASDIDPKLLAVDNPGTVVTYYYIKRITHQTGAYDKFYPYAYDSEEMHKILDSYEITVK